MVDHVLHLHAKLVTGSHLRRALCDTAHQLSQHHVSEAHAGKAQHLAPLKHCRVAFVGPLLAVAIWYGVASGAVHAALLTLCRLIDLAVAIEPDLCSTRIPCCNELQCATSREQGLHNAQH